MRAKLEQKGITMLGAPLKEKTENMVNSLNIEKGKLTNEVESLKQNNESIDNEKTKIIAEKGKLINEVKSLKQKK